MNSLKLWWKTQVLRQDIRSEWMKGLLWAEYYINHFEWKPNTEKDVIDIYEYSEHPNKATGDLVRGVFDYLKHYEERLK